MTSKAVYLSFEMFIDILDLKRQFTYTHNPVDQDEYSEVYQSTVTSIGVLRLLGSARGTRVRALLRSALGNSSVCCYELERFKDSDAHRYSKGAA